MKVRKLLDSFNYAIDGIIHAVRTQRNMRIHMIAALLILTACFFYDLNKLELLLLTITITMVIIAEMFNTAIECTIDVVANYYHPLAKIAKNTAAGAVLIAAINAIVVGYILFWDRLNTITLGLIRKIKHSDPYMIFLILIIVCIATLVVKAIFGEGTPLKGGMPSGHSAIAFCLATTIALVSDEQSLAVLLSYLLAFIVAQSRVDSNVHSIFEVIVGAIFGTLLTIILFNIFG
ncbi:diacylglycerol kinase [Clostridium sp. SYSU_GA19001]|uniref:diacylglycerol kinase n=1 Tax=Clostridium caldaquaticum TaxID=2940653 RepID=UPI002077840A|nr:diacylglycerol kinase [Clostridium caldaquaticum]MCM8710414.1 diacylglycerol kinase [Clostridium caldaquaticum]